MRQRVSDCDAQYSHVLLCHDMQVWSVKIVSCRLRIYGFRTSSQRGLARSSSVARRTAEEAISCARKARRKSQKTSSNHWQTKSIKISQNHYQNHSKPIPFHWQFQCIFGAHPQTLDLHKGLMMLDAEARKAPFLIVSPFSSYVAFESFRCLWVFLEFLWVLIELLSPHFFHSFLTAEVTLSRTLRSASAYGNASNARRMSQCLQPSGAEVKKEKCNNM